MAKEVSTLFTIGDVVTLKLNPEFRGVIESFLYPNNGVHLPTEAKSVNNLHQSGFRARLSSLDADFKTEYIVVPILHLKFVE